MRVAGWVTVAAFVAAACSSSAPSSPSPPDAGYCESNGYSPPVAGECPKGTCKATGIAQACCGSQCPSCESKGLVSYGSNGMCPAGLCPSADVTQTLQCCDVCGPSGPDAGGDGAADGATDGAPDAPADAANEGGDGAVARDARGQ